MAEHRQRRVLRRAGVAVAALLVLVLCFRVAVREVRWLGPFTADLLRTILGRDRVSRLEEWSAAVEDRWNAVSQGSRPPRAISEIEQVPSAAPRASRRVEPPAPLTRRRPPGDVGPMQARVAATGDGVWRPVMDPARPDASPLLFTTMLHPDAKRPWTEAFVVTYAVADLRLRAMAGTVEPRALTAEGRAAERPGLVPVGDQRGLLAAFNGGFKTEHGQHGMFVDGVTLVPARNGLCTIAGFSDGSLAVGSWERIAADFSAREVAFLRQAAPCMVEGGRTNPALADANTRRWGAALAGETVIRRSAFGLDGQRARAYVAITNDTSAPALAAAMRHAGATDVAQLDVNWSYPKFVLFPPDADGVRHAKSLFAGFLVGDDDFVRKPYARDFFYLVIREPALPEEQP